MKYFLDSAKINEIREAYDTFGIDGVTTNPNHIMLSGKPFKEVLKDMVEFVEEKDIVGYEKFPISVEINPHLDDVDEMVAMGSEIAAMCDNFVIKIPCTQSGITAARILEKKGVRTNVTLVFSASQAIVPAKNGSLFVSPFTDGRKTVVKTARNISRISLIFTRIMDSMARPRSSVQPFVTVSSLLTAQEQVLIS